MLIFQYPHISSTSYALIPFPLLYISWECVWAKLRYHMDIIILCSVLRINALLSIKGWCTSCWICQLGSHCTSSIWVKNHFRVNYSWSGMRILVIAFEQLNKENLSIVIRFFRKWSFPCCSILSMISLWVTTFLATFNTWKRLIMLEVWFFGYAGIVMR